MAQLRSTWTEETWASHVQKVAQLKAEKRRYRMRHGIRREPVGSLWALGVAHGRDLLDETPSEVAGVRDLAAEITGEKFRYREDQDGAKVLAVQEKKKEYYSGLLFALKHARVQVDFFAQARREPLQLVAVAVDEAVAV